jgi:hypothetical protein
MWVTLVGLIRVVRRDRRVDGIERFLSCLELVDTHDDAAAQGEDVEELAGDRLAVELGHSRQTHGQQHVIVVEGSDLKAAYAKTLLTA